MRFITNPKLLLYKPTEYGSVASRLLDILSNSDLQGHPLFFHTFSNGGTYIYDHIARQLSKDKERFKLMGNMFDSAPAISSLTNLYRAVHTSTPGGKFRKTLLGSMVVIYAALYILYHTIKCYVINGTSYKSPSMDMYETLISDPHQHPQLFLYSKSDNINEHQFIENFMEKRKSLGVKVFEKCWLHSPHVLHYPNHKEEYVEAVKNFTSYCLKEQPTLQRETNGDLANGFHGSEHKQHKK